MILFVGDSNLRNVVEENQTALKATLKEDIAFEQAGTNEALKTVLEAAILSDYTRVVIGTILNEIAAKGKTVKTRDDIINSVTKEQADIVAGHAGNHPDTLFIILQPLMRYDPAWLTDRIKIITLYLKDFIEKSGASNAEFGYPTLIGESDISPDKVHLNEDGKKKYLQTLIGARISQEAMSDWSVTPNRTGLRSNTKRQRQISFSEDDASKSKKPKETDFAALMSKLIAMDDRMEVNGKKVEERTEIIMAKMSAAIETTSNNAKKIDELEKKQDICNTAVASMREDLDAIENEGMRNIIMVRKLKHDGPLPPVKSEINTILKTVAQNLLVRLGGHEDMIKFVTMAYNDLDQTKQQGRIGTVPAFKIGFKHKEDAVKFKESGTKAAKDKDSDLHKVVFAYQHCSATRIRTQIMWKMVNQLKAQGKEAWVNLNMSKPKLQIKSDKKYPTEYTFVESINKFKDLVKDAGLKEANDQARKHFKNQCKQLFIILSD